MAIKLNFRNTNATNRDKVLIFLFENRANTYSANVLAKRIKMRPDHASWHLRELAEDGYAIESGTVASVITKDGIGGQTERVKIYRISPEGIAHIYSRLDAVSSKRVSYYSLFVSILALGVAIVSLWKSGWSPAPVDSSINPVAPTLIDTFKIDSSKTAAPTLIDTVNRDSL